jgi:hypothetical protein
VCSDQAAVSAAAPKKPNPRKSASGLAIAIFARVRSCPIVLGEPIIEIRLQFLQVVVEFLAKRGGVKLFMDGAMEAFADAVSLRMPSLGAAVIDVLHRQI